MTPTSPVTYELIDQHRDDEPAARAAPIALVTMDDGKVNVMSMTMLEALGEALDQAESDGAVVLLSGREGVFSAGYDVAMFDGGEGVMLSTVGAGGDLVLRVLSTPQPVVVACTGHAIAQGAFLLLAADARIGARGDFKIGLNEVVIGLTIPWYGIEVARSRLTPSRFNHATTTGALYAPEQALTGGFFDELADPADLSRVAMTEAKRLSLLDLGAHAGTKARTRLPAIDAIRSRHAKEFRRDAASA